MRAVGKVKRVVVEAYVVDNQCGAFWSMFRKGQRQRCKWVMVRRLGCGEGG